MPRPRPTTRPRAQRAALVVGSLLISAGAEAQSVRLNRYDAPERADDGFAVRRITDLGKRRIGLVSVLDWAKHPLSVSVVSVDGSTTQRLIARDQLSMASALTLTGWNRALFFAKLDATLHMAGEDPGFTPLAPADRAGLGNTTIGGRVRLNAPSARVGVGLDAAIALPTGGLTQTYRGEDRVNGRVGMIADGRWSRLRATLNAGAAIREQIGLASSALGSELLVAGALAVRAARRLELELDVTGASALDHGLGHFGSRVEWLLGARTGGGPFSVGAAIGTGVALGAALGVPSLRGVVQLGVLFDPPAPRPRLARKRRAPAPQDGDADGLADGEDACPSEAEDQDGVDDGDGCPDRDDDRDGVNDDADQCASAPEDRDGFADGDGCPDPDNDGDGVLDAQDRCASTAGPTAAGGCPVQVRLLAAGELASEPALWFAEGTSAIGPHIAAVLSGLSDVLQNHPSARIRVVGHTDDRERAGALRELAKERALAVARLLEAEGVVRGRLQVFACGELWPVASNREDAERAHNRRVSLRVIDAKRDALRTEDVAGCTRVPLPRE